MKDEARYLIENQMRIDDKILIVEHKQLSIYDIEKPKTEIRTEDIKKQLKGQIEITDYDFTELL